MLSELHLPLDVWHETGPRALSVWPLERVVITNVPGLTFVIEPPDEKRAWLLTVTLATDGSQVTATQTFVNRAVLVAGIAHESARLCGDVWHAASGP